MIASIFMKDALHTIAQGLLYPTIFVLMGLVVLGVITAGGLLVELITERRLLKANIPELMAQIHGKPMEEIRELIEKSLILKRQRKALASLISYCRLPDEERSAIAKRLLATEEFRYDRITGRTDLVARVAPMLGLMGTLIPLGPGLLALGQGDTKTLSDSLLIAFDTTIAGLAAAVICYGISRLRRRWYEDYMVSLEGIMECILEEAKEWDG